MTSITESLGGAFLHVGSDWTVSLSTYPDRTPILVILAGFTTVSVCITGRDANQAAVEFARDLAGKAARFAAEVERVHELQHPVPACQDGSHSGNGEAA